MQHKSPASIEAGLFSQVVIAMTVMVQTGRGLTPLCGINCEVLPFLLCEGLSTKLSVRNMNGDALRHP